MQAGTITIDGIQVGLIEISLSDEVDKLPDFEGYTPRGRAEDGLGGGERQHDDKPHHRLGHEPHGQVHDKDQHEHKNKHHFPGHSHHPATGKHHHPKHDHDQERISPSPKGDTYDGSSGHGKSYPQGTEETDRAIVGAAREHNLDPNFMRGIASIESSTNPSSNANKRTQYKGLYQIGHDEWRRTGEGGNIYSAKDNARAAARLFNENGRQFRKHFGRDPTETELYMMHQQGLGFYTRGVMTNIKGNPYPGMHGPQTHETFEAGWGKEIAKRKAAFSKNHPPAEAKTKMPTETEPM